MDFRDTEAKIHEITAMMVRNGLSEDQNYPSVRNVHGQHHIQYDGYEDISVALKDVAYSDLYKYLDEERQYNLKFLDGGLIQMQYCFQGRRDLMKHRLSYFPSPSFESFQNDPQIYLDDSILYSDVIERSILPVPVRFDYAPNDAIDLIHPHSHLTLGQYKNCRIPVNAPLCPATFINFIIHSFYFTAAAEINICFDHHLFKRSISVNEEARLHLNIV